MQATHVSRSRIARQMTSKGRCVGQKSRRAREMQAQGAVAALLHSSAYRPAVRALAALLRRCKRINIHEKRRMRQTHTWTGTAEADELSNGRRTMYLSRLKLPGDVKCIVGPRGRRQSVDHPHPPRSRLG